MTPDIALTESAAKHWLTVARENCDGCGPQAEAFGSKKWREAHCWNLAEHQRTAKTLQREVEPLVEALRRADRWLQALGGHEEQCNEEGSCQCGLSSLLSVIAAALHARGQK